MTDRKPTASLWITVALVALLVATVPFLRRSLHTESDWRRPRDGYNPGIGEGQAKSFWSWMLGLPIVPMLYVLSDGPFVWMLARDPDSKILNSIAPLYLPLTRVTITGPEWMADPLFWYENLGLSEGWRKFRVRNLPLRREIYRQYGEVL